MSKGRLTQLDVLKGLAALAVVATHSYQANKLVGNWAVLHVWQAVPVFVVVLGVTSAMSFQRAIERGAHVLLTPRYLLRRGTRILLPFAFVWVVAASLGRAKGKLAIGPLSALLRLPYGGPGNYFVPLVVSLLLIAPLIFAAYRRWPRTTLVMAFAADVAFELVAPHIGVFTAEPFLFSIAFPRYLAAFALGFWLADGDRDTRLKWAVLVVGGMCSLGYLVVGNLGLWTPPFRTDWRTQNVLAVFYPALIVAVGMRLLPASGRGFLSDGLGRIGRASYHVFLMQMVYFSLVGQGNHRLLFVNVVMTTFLGLGFFATEEWIRGRMVTRVPDVVLPSGAAGELQSPSPSDASADDVPLVS